MLFVFRQFLEFLLFNILQSLDQLVILGFHPVHHNGNGENADGIRRIQDGFDGCLQVMIGDRILVGFRREYNAGPGMGGTVAHDIDPIQNIPKFVPE